MAVKYGCQGFNLGNMVGAYSKFRLAHQRVNRKKAASTNEAILLASVLKPQAIKHAPMKEEPR